jgi:hypothetical protein
MAEHMQINKCDTPHQQNEGKIRSFHTFKKAFDKIQHSFMKKNKQIRYRRSIY